MAAERKIGPWSTEEDRVLVENQKKLGNKWSKISVMLPGRTDNDVKVRSGREYYKCFIDVHANSVSFSADYHVKNRWWSQQRNARNDRPPTKKSARQRKATKKCTLTPMKSPALYDVTSMNSAEFVEKELKLPGLPALPATDTCALSSLSDDQLLDIVAPPMINVGNCPSSIMSDLESYAASSLVALKSGLTPADKDDITFQHEYAVPQVCLQSSVNCKWSYPPPNISNKENIAPHAPPKWTYPPPADNQARAAKANEIFSPSFKPTNKAGDNITPTSAALQLDALPLCDSGPFITHTPMPDDQVVLTHQQVVTMSKIKPSPIVTKNRDGDPPHLFSPLPFYESPESYCEPGLFVQTAMMLE
jgi:hypothetical protein